MAQDKSKKTLPAGRQDNNFLQEALINDKDFLRTMVEKYAKT